MSKNEVGHLKLVKDTKETKDVNKIIKSNLLKLITNRINHDYSNPDDWTLDQLQRVDAIINELIIDRHFDC